jgi:hypothetical protein
MLRVCRWETLWDDKWNVNVGLDLHKPWNYKELCFVKIPWWNIYWKPNCINQMDIGFQTMQFGCPMPLGRCSARRIFQKCSDRSKELETSEMLVSCEAWVSVSPNLGSLTLGHEILKSMETQSWQHPKMKFIFLNPAC